MGKEEVKDIFFTEPNAIDIQISLEDTSDNIIPFPNKNQSDIQDYASIPLIELNRHKQNKVLIVYTIEEGTDMKGSFQQNKQPETTKSSSRKDDLSMDWQEKYIDKLDRDVDEVKKTITASEERISRMIESSLTEMRDRDNQRQQDMNQIRSSIDSINDRIKNLTITAVVAIASMVVTFIVATLINN